MPSKIFIDPTSRIFYTSFYIKGLYDVFGKGNVSFSSKYFKDLDRKTEAFSFEHYFAFVIIDDNKITKVALDFCDPTDINPAAYNWCDVYAKINVNYTQTDEKFLEKLVVIPPGFGIQIWNLWQTAYHCFSNLLKCQLKPLVAIKRFLQDYWQQYKRPSLVDYQKQSNNSHQKPYVFVIATLWEDDEHVNAQRKGFIDSIKTKNCVFEGGFFATEDHPKYSEYKQYTFDKAYPGDTYLEKTKQSFFVFNTPAVHHCHGWKLAEYLAMGKAIISTPLSNELPAELKHAKHLHFISNHTELDEAVSTLLEDENYRDRLSGNVTEYYKTFVTPEAVIRNLVSKIN